MTAHQHLTECGLPGVAAIPYGLHMCHLYRDREELTAALVSYFSAGLRNNERCIWITAEPLLAADARAALERHDPAARQAIETGALVIRDYSEWYVSSNGLQGEKVVDFWLAEEERALAAGYRGLRITGNVTFLTPQTWQPFMDYEEAVNAALSRRRIVSLCSYQLPRSQWTDVLDVLQRHHCALNRADADSWQIVTGDQQA